MNVINDELLNSLRDKWRCIPDHMKDEAPELVSMVSLDENGSIIPISRTAIGFCVELPELSVAFRNLQDAEVFLAGYLLGQDGPNWNIEWPLHA